MRKPKLNKLPVIAFSPTDKRKNTQDQTDVAPGLCPASAPIPLTSELWSITTFTGWTLSAVRLGISIGLIFAPLAMANAQPRIVTQPASQRCSEKGSRP